MSEIWQYYSEPADAEFQREVPNLDAALLLRGERVSGEDDTGCLVDRIEIGGQGYYLKRYLRTDFHPRDFLFRSKLRTEWENLLLFRKLNIPTPLPVVMGEKRLLGLFDDGVMISSELTGARDLAEIVESQPGKFADREWFSRLCQQVGPPLRRLHKIGFAHNDLNWRNLLVTEHDGLKVYFFDSPRGRRWPWPLRSFRIAKDLTHLDKLGRRYLSRSQRLRFYLAYLGHNNLTKKDKKLLARILRRQVDKKYRPD